MKTLIVYSTISGNTKAVCERIYEALNAEKEILNVKDIKNLKIDDYDNFIIGFWCDKGTMDKDSIEFLKTLNNKNVYFLGTLGARPDSEHWNDVFENAKKLCSENNNFKNGLLIWGRISKEMQDMMKKFPAGHPHGEMCIRDRFCASAYGEVIDLGEKNIYSETGFEKNLRNSTTSPYIITSKDIETKGYTSVSEILDSVPGVNVQEGLRPAVDVRGQGRCV